MRTILEIYRHALLAKEGPWEDLRFPAQGINPPGAVTDPTREAITGLFLFSPTAVNRIGGVAQLPHTYREGSHIVPHVHWQPTTTGGGNVLWRLYYSWSNIGEVAVLPLTNTPVDNLDPAGTVAQMNLLTSFGDVIGIGKEISSLLFWFVDRVGDDSSDTYGGNARLVEFDIHYQLNSFGSNEEFRK